ncbi:hypothetical protein [Zhongshania sp.]|uniref:hypothetical protein n=1 Tax=Zhongshania sp. TaxID=1971902 RepID=UPI003569127B
MTKVFCDQLAALPLSEVYINFSAGGRYTAAIALEGRVLDVYENDGVALQRLSLQGITGFLTRCGCPQQSFVIDLGVDLAAQPSVALPVSLSESRLM